MTTANRVEATTFTTPSDREIVMTRVVDAPRRLVFEAWTNPQHVPQWLLGPSGWRHVHHLVVEVRGRATRRLASCCSKRSRLWP